LDVEVIVMARVPSRAAGASQGGDEFGALDSNRREVSRRARAIDCERRLQMSNDPLATYLQDHLAGAASAIELLEMLRDQDVGEALGNFAGQLVADVEADRQVLEALARQVARGPACLRTPRVGSERRSFN
jgi:hypothetical protein